MPVTTKINSKYVRSPSLRINPIYKCPQYSIAHYYFFLAMDRPLAPVFTTNESEYMCFCALSNPQAPNLAIHVNISSSNISFTESYTGNDCVDIGQVVPPNTDCVLLLVMVTAENVNGVTTASQRITWNNTRIRGIIKIMTV